jgi:hypothetical protein
MSLAGTFGDAHCLKIAAAQSLVHPPRTSPDWVSDGRPVLAYAGAGRARLPPHATRLATGSWPKMAKASPGDRFLKGNACSF